MKGDIKKMNMNKFLKLKALEQQRVEALNDDLYIKDCGKYYTIINLNGKYKNHCHIDNKKSAELFKKQVERKIVPRGSYFRSCALRVTTDDSYKEKINIKIAKDKDRQFFYRVNRGLKK